MAKPIQKMGLGALPQERVSTARFVFRDRNAMAQTRVDATCENDHGAIGILDFDFDEMDVARDMKVPSGKCPICGADLVLEAGHYEKAEDSVLRWVRAISVN